MNKAIKYLLSVAVGLAGLTSCETYGDPKIDESAIGVVMSGTWIPEALEDITDPANPEVLKTAADFFWAFDDEEWEYYRNSGTIVQTYATAAESKTEMWFWQNVGTAFRGKVGIDLVKYEIIPTKGHSNMPLKIDPSDKTEVAKTYDYEVLSGRVAVEGYSTKSGHKSDLLTIIYTSEAPATKGKTLKLTAWRDSLWPEDYPVAPPVPAE